MTSDIAIKRSRIFGWLFVVAGVLELIMMALFALIANVAFSDIYSTVVVVLGDETISESAVGVVYGLMMAFLALVGFLSFYVGYQGVKAARGDEVSKGYITIAWMLLVIQVLSTVSSLLGVIQSFTVGNVCNLLINLIWVVIYYQFIQASKFLHVEAEKAIKKKIVKATTKTKVAKEAKTTKAKKSTK